MSDRVNWSGKGNYSTVRRQDSVQREELLMMSMLLGRGILSEMICRLD